MRKLIFILLFSFSAFPVFGQSKLEKISISYWYVFGRFPSQAELNYWNGQGEQSISWYVSNHHNFLKSDDASNTASVNISYKDAFGRSPSKGELDFWKKQKRTYADLMNEHVKYLLVDGNEKKATIGRAYQTVMARQPGAEELAQWLKGNFSYLIISSCLYSYKTTGYKLQSVEGVLNFMKSAWETSANFIVNAGTAVYKASASAVSSAVAATQRVLTLVISKSVTDEMQRFDSRVISRTEDGKIIMTAGAAAMQGIGQLINLDGGTVVGTNGGTLIGAGGLN